MTDVRAFFAQAIRDEQQMVRNMTDPEPEWRWFGSLELEDVTVEGDIATFAWRDPADGTRHGWRYRFRTRGEMEAVGWRCWEEFQTSEPTEPDENGVRWWGVHQWVDGELILDRGRIAGPSE
ncbi:MAG: hypothetical protein GEV03_05515 [Streptosporangiales bacterium]|nr:hypothetical protein [Streptosporangiales bacterium]